MKFRRAVKIALAWSDAAVQPYIDQSGSVATLLVNDPDVIVDTGDGGACPQDYGNNFEVVGSNPDLDLNRGARVKRVAVWMCFVISIGFSLPGWCVTLQRGDVLDASVLLQDIGGPIPGDVYLVRAPQQVDSIIHYEGVSVGTFGVGVDRTARIYVLAPEGSGIDLYDASANRIRYIFPGITFTAPGRIVFDAAGNWYVTGGWKLYKLDPSGTLVTTFPLQGASGIDLAADQCTLFFTLGSTLGRFDVCRGARLADVTNALPANAYDLRIVPDGTLLVALGDSAVRVSVDGRVIRTYPTLAHAIALDPTGQSFWAGPGITKINIETGATEAFVFRAAFTNGLAVVGEPRAATGGVAGIPQLSWPTLFILAAALAGIGLLRHV